MSCFDASDLELGPLPAPPAAPVDSWGRGTVLLTGASGFLGTPLLERILDRSEARVVCVARGDGSRAPQARIESAMARRGWTLPSDRVTVLDGDLAAPRLGLDEATFVGLSERIDLVIHNGAHVRWWGDVETIRDTNIESLRTILRFAATARPKRVAFTSSVAVFNADAYCDAEVALEAPLHESPVGLRSPYVQSKWVGERLCIEAAAQGVPVTIVRVPYLLPDSRHAVFNPTGAVELLLGASIAMGSAPDLGLRLPLAPVDACADTIVRILGTTSADLSFHHVVRCEPPTWRRFVEAIEAEGRAVRLLPPVDWFDALRDRCRSVPGLRAALALMSQDPTRTLWSHSNVCRLRFDDGVTRSLLPDLAPTQPLGAGYLAHAVRAIAADPGVAPACGQEFA